jgi:cell division protein FtsL
VRAPARNAPARDAPARRAVREGGGLLLGVLGWLETLSSHRLLDRLIRGRMWIGIVAFALIGIVTLQLGLLKLNSSIGRALETESRLQNENAALSIENSEMAGGSRVESQAGRLGMRLTAAGGLQFHESHARSDVPQAAAALKEAPKPAEASAEAPKPAEAGAEAAGRETAGTEAASGSSRESSSETSSSAGRAGAEGAGASTQATSEAGGGSGTAGAASPSSSSGASEPSGEVGGGTPAPGG